MILDDPMPDQLGNYTLIRQIGKGGFATVYLGQHVHLKNYVAVKVLHAPIGTTSQIELFRREAQTIAELAHPNIVRVLDFDAYDEFAFLVMDYAPFGSLRRQHKLGTLVELPSVVSYVNQIAEALHYAHKHRIIHRDVKPENMLVGRDSRILLSDFGISALLSGSSRMQTGEAVGTVAYIAPEQIQGKARPASDQYALAVSIYEWLTGRQPFTGTLTEVVAKHLSASPPPLRRYAPDLQRVILKALEKDPMQRFRNILDFAKALSEAARVEPRAPEEEKFVALNDMDQVIFDMVSSSSKQKSSRRDLASIRTVIVQQSQVPQPSRKYQRRLSRRAVFFGMVALVGAGSIGATMAALRQAPAAPAHLQKNLPTQTGQGNTPTTQPIATPTEKSTEKPTPDPVPTEEAPAPTQPVLQQPPAQPPAPTPTPTPLVPTGILYTTYRGHTSVVFAVAWSPDGQRLVSGSGDQTAQVWSTNGSRITSYRHRAAVTSVAWAPDNTRIASASDDATVQVWDAATGSPIYTCRHSSSVHSVAWSPDGKRIASGSTDRTVRVWDAATGSLLMTYSEHLGTVWGVAWSPDGRSIASASTDHTGKVWNVTTGVTTVTYHSSDIIGNVAWSPDGQRIASAGNNTDVDVWNAGTGIFISTYIGHAGIAYGVSWSPDGKSVASASEDATVSIIDPSQGTARYIYRGHASYVFGVAWSPDGKHIASGSDDKTVQIWF